MAIMKSTVSALLLVGSTSMLFGCVLENEPPRELAPDPKPYTPDPGPPANGGPPRSPSPMLVEIDSDQTLSSPPGDGVGVFVEYARGGHWHLWWTCDTAQTSQSCEFSVSATAASGTITNLDASELEGGFVASPTPSRVDAKSTTTTQVHGIRFDTEPGAVLTVEAAVGGVKDGAFLFFVQDGKINGGFSGKLTNPLQFQGSAP
jgi:hypothetical protein